MIEGLTKLSPDEAFLRQALAEALNGAPVGDAVMRATLGEAAPDVAWFRCADGLAFALLRLGGRDVRADPEDGLGAALLLERAEPCLAAIEAALSITLEPSDLGPLEDGTPTILARLEVEAHSLLFLAVPHAHPVLATPAAASPALTGHIPVPARIRFAGPRLTPGDAASLGAGDLLLLGRGPFDARLEAGDAPALSGRLDPGARLFLPNHP